MQIPMPWEMTGTAPDTPVLLGFSGGADSRALLELLRQGAERDGFEIVLAHVHHGIRGAEADRDQAFCESTAAALGLRIFCAKRDVPALARESGRTVEEEARRVRYEFFSEIMERERIPLLATAHQADDQLETMLFRICRGTGVRGLCGIPAVRRFGNGYAVRPLLGIPAKEIRAFCAAHGLEYMTDSTNADDAYARNLIRAEVVPVLERLYADPQKRAAALARELNETEDYLQTEADAFLERNPGDRLFCRKLAALHPALRDRILDSWLKVGGVTPERVHLEELNRLLIGENGRYCSVPGGKSVVKRRNCLELIANAPVAPDRYELKVTAGEIAVPGTGWKISVVRITDDQTKYQPTQNRNRMILPCEMADGTFFRPMREGDRIYTRGMHHPVRR